MLSHYDYHHWPNSESEPLMMKEIEYERIIDTTVSWPGGPATALPTGDELQAVLAFIQTGHTKLENLDVELKRLRVMQREVEPQRRSLEKLMEAYRAYVSPVRHIPDDIVREIMMRCLPTDQESPPSHINTHMAPILLTHICRRWRVIALSTPALWATLHVSFRLWGPKSSVSVNPWGKDYKIEPIDLSGWLCYTPQAEVPKPVSLWEQDTSAMRQWISLSGSFPLSISFGYIPQDTNGIRCIDDFFNFLLTTAPQWRSIDFLHAFNGQVEPPLSFQEVASTMEISNLLSLRLRLDRPFVHPTPGDTSSAIATSRLLMSPRLRHLRCDIVDFVQNWQPQVVLLSMLPVLQWSQLSTLAISCTSSQSDHVVEDCMRVLTTCHKLEHLRVHARGRQSILSLEQQRELVTLPVLQTLDLDLAPAPLRCLLHILMTPALEELAIQVPLLSGRPTIPDEFATELLEFIKRSNIAGFDQGQMQSLRLNPLHYTRSIFYRILGGFPYIHKLSLETQFEHASMRVPWDGPVEDYDSIVDDAFLLRLTGMLALPPVLAPVPGGPPSCLLPRLTDIALLTRTSFSSQTLLQFLRAKRQQFSIAPTCSSALSRLRRLTLAETPNGLLCGSTSLETASVAGTLLRPLQQDGLVVAIQGETRERAWVM